VSWIWIQRYHKNISHSSPFRGSNTPNFWAWIDVFKPNSRNRKTCILSSIKTTASIPTKFRTVIKTTKCPSWVVSHMHYKSKMADGRHLEKSKNSCISAAVGPIFTKCGKQMLGLLIDIRKSGYRIFDKYVVLYRHNALSLRDHGENCRFSDLNEWMNENARILSAFENRLRAGFV